MADKVAVPIKVKLSVNPELENRVAYTPSLVKSTKVDTTTAVLIHLAHSLLLFKRHEIQT